MNPEYRSPIPATRRAPWRRLWPLAVPVVWCVLCLMMMRPDAITNREWVRWDVKCLLYDEFDLTAIALRGANAHMGRLPGRVDEPGLDYSADLAWQLDAPPKPYQPRFYLEYPAPSLGLFWLGVAVQPGAANVPLPPAVADDSHQFHVAIYEPRNDAERAVWTMLGNAVRFYLVLMAAGAVALIVVIGRGYERGQPWHPALWLAVLPGAVYFSINRFDVLPTLAVALSLFCLGRGARGWSGAWLAVGVLLKVYPILFVPVILRYLGVKLGVRWLVAFTATGLLGMAISISLTDREATIRPILVQMARTLEQEERTIYGRLLPRELADSKLGRQALLAVAVLAAIAIRPRDVNGVLRRCAVVAIVFVNLAVFWSPQWMLWFLPLTVPLARHSRRLIWPIVALDLVSYWAFPIFVWNCWPHLSEDGQQILSEITIWTRIAIWGWLLGEVVYDEWRERPPTVDAAAAIAIFHASRDTLLAECLRVGGASGVPRGLTWRSLEPTAEATFATDRDTGHLVALQPARATFEPQPGSDLEDVPQAREPREVVALFAFEHSAWHTTGRLVFNLTVSQVVERSAGKYQGERPG